MSKAESVNALARGLDLLKEASHMGPFTLSEMARALDEPTSTVDRWIKTLAEKGFLERIGDKWRVGHEASVIWSHYCLALQKTIRDARRKLQQVHIPGAEAIEWTN